MKKIVITILLQACFFTCPVQARSMTPYTGPSWWKEIPYTGEFTLKHGMMAVNSKDDIQALVTKKETADAQKWDLFLAKWDAANNIWERQFFVGRGDKKSTAKLAVSKDGAVFIKKPKKQKGQEYEDLLVRIVDGREAVVRDFGGDEVSDPSMPSKSVTLIDMAAVNKDELWCLLREVTGDVPRRMKDGTYVTTGKARIRTFVEKWDGVSFKQVGNDLPSTGSGGIAVGHDGSVYVFVRGIIDPTKLLKWNGSAWEAMAIPLGTSDRIMSLSVVDACNLWLLLGDGNVFQWNGKALEPRSGNSRFQKIYAAPDVVLVQNTDGNIFQWAGGKEAVSFFRHPIEWIKQLFGW